MEIKDEGVYSAGAVPADPQGAGPLLRSGAFAIDVLLVGALGTVWDFVVWRVAPLSAPTFVPLGVSALFIFYYGWATARHYHTPGQGFTGLTLARIDYQPLTTRRAYARLLLFTATGGMVLPNIVMMVFDKKRRTVHDWMTKTWVYALPGADPRRRRVAVAAALLLFAFSGLRLALAASDWLERRGALTLEKVGAGEDAKRAEDRK